MVAVLTLVEVRVVAHRRRSVTKEQEEHATPSNDVEAVDDDEKAERGDSEFAKGFEADDRGFTPGMFRWERVPVWVYAFSVRTGFFCRWGCGGCGATRGFPQHGLDVFGGALRAWVERVQV